MKFTIRPRVEAEAKASEFFFGLGTVIRGGNQGLNEIIKEKDARIAALEQSVSELKELVARLAKNSEPTPASKRVHLD